MILSVFLSGTAIFRGELRREASQIVLRSFDLPVGPLSLRQTLGSLLQTEHLDQVEGTIRVPLVLACGLDRSFTLEQGLGGLVLRDDAGEARPALDVTLAEMLDARQYSQIRSFCLH